jgi:hypothetical protein
VANSLAVVTRGSQGQGPAEQRHETRVEPRDVPPRGEGLDESQELRPDQEPGRRGKTRAGENFRGEMAWCALHEWIPLSRYDMRKGRPEQHHADEPALS